jgi:hypothetical protein
VRWIFGSSPHVVCSKQAFSEVYQLIHFIMELFVYLLIIRFILEVIHVSRLVFILRDPVIGENTQEGVFEEHSFVQRWIRVF